MYKYSIRNVVFTGFVGACLIGLFSGCSEGRPVEIDPEFSGIEPSEVVLATVGGTPITLVRLLGYYEFHGVLDDNLIKYEVFRQEAARRGIVISQEEIEALYQFKLTEQGGYSAWFEQVQESSPFIPFGILPEHLRTEATMALMRDALFLDVYEKDHGPMTREEAQEYWDSTGSTARNDMAEEIDMPVELVTIDDAWDAIEKRFSQGWIQQNDWGEEIKSWRERLMVTNYARMIVESEGFFDERVEPVQADMELDPTEVTLARVGDTPITLADYMQYPMLYSILDQKAVRHVLLLAEVETYQLEVDEEEIEEIYQEIIEQQGGEEALLEQALEIFPIPTIFHSIRRDAEIHILSKVVFEAVYAREHGPMTREEAVAFMDDPGTGDYVRNQVALESGIDREDVTVDDAWDTIEEYLMQAWIKEKNPVLKIDRERDIMDAWLERHPVVNYVRLYVDAEDYPMEIEVPSLHVESEHEGEEEGLETGMLEPIQPGSH